MLNSSGVFDYVNVLGTSLDAAATRNDIINNNIANVNTPNYKRKDIRFETELKHAFARSSEDTVDARVKNLDLEALTPKFTQTMRSFPSGMTETMWTSTMRRQSRQKIP